MEADWRGSTSDILNPGSSLSMGPIRFPKKAASNKAIESQKRDGSQVRGV